MLHTYTRIYLNHSRCLWWGQWQLKASKHHNFWRFIKLAIPTSLYEGPFFYFYVESPPSTFMHRLREHSCHSEYNVHSPKIYYWLIHDYGFCLFLNYGYLVTLLNLKVSYEVMFWYSMKDKLKTTLLCFSICSKHTLDFQWIITHDLLFVLLFML
jgi:hypothetical protein